MLKNVEKCVEVLRAGGLILYPTDTVWGIGCDATNEEAVAKVYALKRSEEKTSMLCLMRDADMVVRYVNRAPGIAFEVMELSDKPLTAILPGAVGVAENLIPEAKTLGVRVPQHEFCQALLRKFGKPIVSTSANISLGFSPYCSTCFRASLVSSLPGTLGNSQRFANSPVAGRFCRA